MMEKPAATDYPVHDLIRRRWSPRAFLDQPVEPGKLRSALEAARWAPSSLNEQPWRFIVATRDEEQAFADMVNCLMPGNQVWAGAAGVLVLTVAASSFERDGRANRHAFHDVGLAMAQFVLQATSDGLSVHQMAGFDRDRARQTFRIPDGFDPVTIVAVGYLGDPGSLSEALRDRELMTRVRRPQAEFVFRGAWGDPA